MPKTAAEQISQIENDVKTNVGKYKDTKHLAPVFTELKTLQTSDGSNFDKDLVKINTDLESQNILPDVKLVKTGKTADDGFAAINTKDVETSVENAAKSGSDLTAVSQSLEQLKGSESSNQFNNFLDKLNSDIANTGYKLSENNNGFHLTPFPITPPSTDNGSDASSDEGSDDGDDSDSDGSDGSGGSTGGGYSGGDYGAGGGGGGYSGGGGDGGGESGGDGSTYTGTLGNLPGDGTGNSALSAAESQIGVPYVFAGATPGKEFDCSGLTMWAWAQAGVQLPHSAAEQYNDTAHVTHVPLSQLQPGDLLFYNDGGSIHHVAMYVGNGKMIEAPQSGENVRITNVRTYGLMPMAGRPHK